MKRRIEHSPVAFSIIFTFTLAVVLGIISALVSAVFPQGESDAVYLVMALVNLIIGAAAIFLFGVINGCNSLAHVFNTKGLVKGFNALYPVMGIFVLNLLLTASNVSYISTENIGRLPVVVLMQGASALMQTVLFRGLLITALFIKMSETKNARLRSIFIASALFLVMYIPMSILNTGGLELMNLMNTFIISAGMCAAYMYGKRLLPLIIVQGTWQVLGGVISVLSVSEEVGIDPAAGFIFLLFLAIVLVVAIIVGKRADAFEKI
ncbi:MAG: hypothetical protein FWC16_13490 [Defluviitaleaceae bacterium]|nr:hypothetical protein [Defluviitaleaceae bacterium]MCL2275934.1 hypothetical protein [Defluviitaleaceae bacterium]